MAVQFLVYQFIDPQALARDEDQPHADGQHADKPDLQIAGCMVAVVYGAGVNFECWILNFGRERGGRNFK